MPRAQPTVLAALLALLLASCGEEPVPTTSMPNVPTWAKVAPEQIAEAEKHGVPVAFENDLGMRFVLIPAGTFLMGSPEDEEGRRDDETQHEVTISQPFYMSIYEVTNGQYRRFRPDHESGEYEGYSLDGDGQPVVEVSWEEASAFSAWLSALDAARVYYLPREAEWEWACREGGSLTYGSSADLETVAHNASISDRADPSGAEMPEIDDGYAVSAPVGSFRPSVWGVYDLHGNAQEWCGDWYGPYPPNLAVDPVGCREHDAPQVTLIFYGADDERLERTDRARVTRGSNWADVPFPCCQRCYLLPDVRNDELGFRLVSPLPEPGEGGR